MKCILSILVFCVSYTLSEENIFNHIDVCHRNDPNLNQCVQDKIEKFRPMLADGINDLLIPPCDPLLIPKVKIRQNAGAISMDSEYTDILVHGLSKFVIRNVNIDLASNRFHIDMWFPDLKMNAKYHIFGKILLMPLTGSGSCNGNFTDIDASVTIDVDRVMVNNREYLKVKHLDVEFNMGGANVRLNDLFNGDSELGEAMNIFLNENWRSVAAEMRPALKDSIINILLNVTERTFSAFPMDEILPN